MKLLIHGGIGQKTKEHWRNLTEAVFMSVIHESLKYFHVCLALNHTQTLIQLLLELFPALLIDQFPEEVPMPLFMQVLFEVAQDVVAVEQMHSLKLPVSFQAFESSA